MFDFGSAALLQKTQEILSHAWNLRVLKLDSFRKDAGRTIIKIRLVCLKILNMVAISSQNMKEEFCISEQVKEFKQLKKESLPPHPIRIPDRATIEPL